MKIALICSDSGSGGLLKYIKGFLETPTDHTVNLYCGKNMLISDSKYINVIRTELANESGMDLLCSRPLRSEFVEMIDFFSPDVVVFMNGWMRKGLEQYKCISILHNQLAVNLKLLLKQKPLKLVGSLLAVRKAVLYSMRSADGMIFLSESSKKDTDRLGYRYKNGKVILFGHEARSCQSDSFQPHEMIYVSTQFPYKNHVKLIKALGKVKKVIPEFHVSFVGCRFTAKLEKLVKANGLTKNITFCGWMSHEETLDAIGKAGIYLHASMIESTSNGVLEGLVPGNTIVCSNIGVFMEALGDHAYYFSPYSVEEMASAILKAMQQPKPVSSETCQNICKKYDHMQGVMKVYAYASEIKDCQ